LTGLFSPLARSVAQLGSAAFVRVLALSLAWSAAVFVALHVVVLWAIHQALAGQGWLALGAEILGGIGASLLALWLFLPLAALIAALFIDRVARAVERRHYPDMPPAPGASFRAELADGLLLAWRILLLNLVALVLALLIPGIGLLLAWAVGAYAIGRGLFMAVALRRHDRRTAEALYAAHRPVILTQGAVLALAGYVPLLNLLIPVLGTAAMVHVLDAATQRRFNRM
jgi:CysZ protein